MADAGSPVVAILGTGIMGAGMARNVAGAGLEVRVWNRTREKAEPLAAAGATIADTPAEAVRGADVVVTMLDAGPAVTETLRAAADGLGTGAVWLQMATVGLDAARELVALGEELGLTAVDAPVLGTRAPAESGDLIVLACGPEEALHAARPVLEAVGAKTVWLGERAEHVTASRLKLALNSWVINLTSATAEALVLADGLGVDPGLVLETLAGGPLDVPYLQLKGRAMIEDQTGEDVSFTAANALKDAGLVVAAAEEAGVRLDLAPAARDRLQRAVDAGHGERDLGATFLADAPAAADTDGADIAA